MWVTILGHSLLLILGWLLGILSQPIVERIRNYYKKKEVKRGILIELEEYKYRLAIRALLIEQDFGTYDRKLLEWTRDNIKDYESTFTYKKDLMVEGIAVIFR